MAINPTPAVGQRWWENYLTKHTLWEIISANGSLCKIKVIKSTNSSWVDRKGAVIEWDLDSFHTWAFDGYVNIDSYRTILCEDCQGYFVLTPGEEYTGLCRECRKKGVIQ